MATVHGMDAYWIFPWEIVKMKQFNREQWNFLMRSATYGTIINPDDLSVAADLLKNNYIKVEQDYEGIMANIDVRGIEKGIRAGYLQYNPDGKLTITKKWKW